jgi:beta-lactam-binding protein with PASTA domain
VPNVVGQKLAKARTKLRARHCRVGKITRRHSAAAKKGRVLGQSPKASARKRSSGFSVKLTVGRGP